MAKLSVIHKIGIGFAVFIGLIVLVAQFAPDRETEPAVAPATNIITEKKPTKAQEEPKCLDRNEAILAARAFILENLKAPSTAKFQDISDVTANKTASENNLQICTWRVITWVDAQNVYGAMIRSKFIVDVRRTPEGWFGVGIEEITR